MGSGTTLVAALRLRRRALGADLNIEFIQLSLRRICADLVQVEISLCCLDFPLDLSGDPVDRSDRASVRAEGMSSHPKLVQQERRFYFIARTNRRVIFSTLADSLEEAWRKFRSSGLSESDALFIVKTETEIYLA